MSSAKLSAVIQNRVIAILKKDLRKELNTLMPELEIDKKYVTKLLMSQYSLSKSDADKAFNFIIDDISNRSIFVRKTGVAGKPNIFYPGKSKAKNKFAAVKDWKTSISNKLEKEFGTKDFGSKFHLGHGGGGTSAIPAVGYRAVRAAQYLAGRAGAESAIAVLRSTPLIDGITVDAVAKTSLTKSGSFKKKYTVRLHLQSGNENLDQAIVEKLANKNLIDELQRIAIEEDTSPPAITVVKRALDSAINNKKSKNIKSTSKAKVVYKNPKKGKKGVVPPIPRLRDPRGRFTSAAGIQQLIQAQITEKVKENMGEGGSLVNRTGRFAESVTITNITQSRQGTLTAFYNYMKYPYQTFERGFKQGSTRRDPRLLIHKSIRDIAIKLVHRKLNIKTRRV
jgi:hypothetical protein